MKLFQSFRVQAIVPLFLLAGTIAPSLVALDRPKSDEPKSGKGTNVRSRTFDFTYEATLTDLTPGKTARIWLPVPSASDEQDVSVIKKELPGEEQISQDPKFGNKILYLEAKPNADRTIHLSITY